MKTSSIGSVGKECGDCSAYKLTDYKLTHEADTEVFVKRKSSVVPVQVIEELKIGYLKGKTSFRSTRTCDKDAWP